MEPQSNQRIVLRSELRKLVTSSAITRGTVLHHINKSVLDRIILPDVLLDEVLLCNRNVSDNVVLVIPAAIAIRNGANLPRLDSKDSKVQARIELLAQIDSKTNRNNALYDDQNAYLYDSNRSPRRAAIRSQQKILVPQYEVAILLDRQDLLQIDPDVKYSIVSMLNVADSNGNIKHYQQSASSNDIAGANQIILLLEKCISTCSNKCFDTLLNHLTDATFDAPAWQKPGISLLTNAIIYSNAHIVTSLLEYGVEPTASLMTNALLIAQTCTQQSDRIKQDDANAIINLLIQYGYDLNREELDKIQAKIAGLRIDSYIATTPYWKRACNTLRGSMPEKLRGIVEVLSSPEAATNATKQEGCDIIKDVSDHSSSLDSGTVEYLVATPDKQFVCSPNDKQCMMELRKMLPADEKPIHIRTRPFAKKVAPLISSYT